MYVSITYVCTLTSLGMAANTWITSGSSNLLWERSTTLREGGGEGEEGRGEEGEGRGEEWRGRGRGGTSRESFTSDGEVLHYQIFEVRGSQPV